MIIERRAADVQGRAENLTFARRASAIELQHQSISEHLYFRTIHFGEKL
ncbi:MAG: hypothetical protein LH614_20565 [Pyrinomonadaceae bacterium]|nr:hypothetical protein [Pyrinomonadaceae bacterium]